MSNTLENYHNENSERQITEQQQSNEKIRQGVRTEML